MDFVDEPTPAQGAKGWSRGLRPSNHKGERTLMQLTLYTSPGCHLCENMKALLSRIKRRQAFELTEIDISASPALQRLYQNDIPVLLLDGTEVAHHRVDESALLTILGRK